LRHKDLKDLSKRLGRCGKWHWANVLLALALLILGADAGGWVAMWPYVSTNPAPSHENQLIYVVIMVGLGLVGLVALCGALAARSERSESVGNIKEDLDDMLKAWETKEGTDGPS
jgi:hypothetical protein